MINLFWSVFGLGLVFFASPGPINIETVRRGVHSGAWPAFAVQIGAIIAELVLGGAVLIGLAPLLQQPPAARRSVLVGMIAAASNPMSVIMWLAVAGVAPASGIAELQPVHGVIISAGYLLGALTWAMLIALFVGWSRRFVQPHVWRWWNVGSGVLLGAFALRLVWTAATLPVEVTNYFLIRSYQ